MGKVLDGRLSSGFMQLPNVFVSLTKFRVQINPQIRPNLNNKEGCLLLDGLEEEDPNITKFGSLDSNIT